MSTKICDDTKAKHFYLNYKPQSVTTKALLCVIKNKNKKKNKKEPFFVFHLLFEIFVRITTR